jgi:uroporphyrin-III C-methyltransferase/precorrin-2 dehydrogenase/sirohydrochlorin ferrochelatase
MSYFPLFLETKTTNFLVIGAGNIGLAKLQSILEFGGNTVILAQNASDDALDFIKENKIKFWQRSYKAKYLQGFDVIVGATNDPQINKQISKDAKVLGKLVNVVDEPGNSNFIFGASIKKGSITTAISTSGLSPVLARFLKNKLTLALPKNMDFLEKFISKNRNLVKKKLSNLQARRLFWQEALEGQIASEIESGNQDKAQNLLDDKLSKNNNQKQSAVYFIGAGPGDTELVTLKAIKLLSHADVVLYDRLVADEILQYARKDALKINVGKVKDLHRCSQDEIGDLIRKYALQGNIVARLKGGDPSIFGRLDEEINAIANLKIPYQIVPAVSSAIGAAATAGIPLTARNIARGVRFLTVYKNDLEADEYWRDLAKTNDSLVFYMSSHHLELISKNLLKFGKDKTTPIAIIEQGTTKFQKTYISNIGDFSKDFGDKKFISPSLAIIGEVVKNHQKYKWQEEATDGVYFKSLRPREKSQGKYFDHYSN